MGRGGRNAIPWTWYCCSAYQTVTVVAHLSPRPPAYSFGSSQQDLVVDDLIKQVPGISPHFEEVLRGCLQPLPEKRLKPEELLELEWFRQFHGPPGGDNGDGGEDGARGVELSADDEEEGAGDAVDGGAGAGGGAEAESAVQQGGAEAESTVQQASENNPDGEELKGGVRNGDAGAGEACGGDGGAESESEQHVSSYSHFVLFRANAKKRYTASLLSLKAIQAGFTQKP